MKVSYVVCRKCEKLNRIEDTHNEPEMYCNHCGEEIYEKDALRLVRKGVKLNNEGVEELN